jgi:hypothetical protein
MTSMNNSVGLIMMGNLRFSKFEKQNEQFDRLAMSIDHSSTTAAMIMPYRFNQSYNDRAQSAITNALSMHNPFALADADIQIIDSAEIFSYKMKKEYDGTIYAAYCIHIALQSGLKWVVERRYTQFRELRREAIKIAPQLDSSSFPRKVWLFNLSKAALKARQNVLNSFLKDLLAVQPQLLEIGESSMFIAYYTRLSRGFINYLVSVPLRL